MPQAQLLGWPDPSGLWRLRHNAAAIPRDNALYSESRCSSHTASVRLTIASYTGSKGFGTLVARAGVSIARTLQYSLAQRNIRILSWMWKTAQGHPGASGS